LPKKSSTKKEAPTLDFEAAIAELEQLVETMEQGDISLEESLKNFERGIELTRTCQKALQQAEQKVQILTQNNQGEEALEAFSAGGKGPEDNE
jgi:exodeoxyribonuclease VII small subunit